MERLTIHDNTGSPNPRQGRPYHQQQHQHHHQHQQHHHRNASAGGPEPGPPPPPQGPPQLPPQMFTTAAQLLDLTDKKLVLVLRDGRKLIGVLRSWDQFANLVLQDTVERLYAGNLYAEEHVGLYLVRGENVLLLGEIDLDKEDDIPPSLTKASFNEVRDLKNKEEEERKRKDKKSTAKLQTHGFEPEHSGEILF